jgi:REP element-mobilizing transposase RayT
MPVRKDIPYNEGMFFITFTCYKWLHLFEETKSYDLVYGWFDYLEKQNHRMAGYVIMPNHIHALIDFSATTKKINTIIGNGKRFMAYEIIKRLESSGRADMLSLLEKAVTTRSKDRGKLHEVWEESFDWKICETAEFAYQKLLYIHNNPCNGKWNLAEDITKYEHSSARYYITGKHAGFIVTDIDTIFGERYAAEDPMRNNSKENVVEAKGQLSP